MTTIRAAAVEEAPGTRCQNHSPDVRIVEVNGGINRSKKPCGSLTPHGNYGIEDKVVGTISDWIDDNIRHAR